MAEVVLTDVTKVFPPDVVAVDRMNLHIQDREFIVLVGPSGCGKSTTLRMIAGLEEITEGEIRIGQRVVNDVPPKDRDIAMVFQNYALYPHMTVYKNMAFALRMRKYPKREIDARVREAARVLGIEELLDRKPKALSGGQRQRVAVGRAIVRQPKAFLFDEPLSNLDAKLRVEMRAELKRLHRQLQTTTIYVTHDQEEAMTLGDRIVVMRDGVVQQVGAPLEVYEAPANRFVAGFVGTPPMNFMAGRLVAEGGGLHFDEGSFRIRLAAAQAQALGEWAGREVVLGIRPEAMGTSPQGRFAGGDNAVPVRVGVVEPLGEKMDLYVSTPNHPDLVARVDAQRDIEAGQQLRLYLDMTKVHVFAPGQDGANLTAPAAAAVA
ncbi:MAG: glycerol-3-phosphate ABC transporter ATP-binding protein [Planctomycetales bacterium 4484_123]|nr:MAG: glycerol-3-phosphate ABC transporter ATP-binding protein [Planctomycetales bacterium 4484_123]